MVHRRAKLQARPALVLSGIRCRAAALVARHTRHARPGLLDRSAHKFHRQHVPLNRCSSAVTSQRKNCPFVALSSCHNSPVAHLSLTCHWPGQDPPAAPATTADRWPSRSPSLGPLPQRIFWVAAPKTRALRQPRAQSRALTRQRLKFSPPASLPHSLHSIMSNDERTFIAIKPDGVQRGLIAPILGRFENRGFKLVAIKLTQPSEALLREHYADLQSKPFFPGLLKYMTSGPVLATVWEGKDAVKTGRVLLGATNPLASAPGTIRGDFALDVGRNVCHGSDSVESAKKEIALWFKKEELNDYHPSQHAWIYE